MSSRDVEWITSADDVWSGFFSGCAANPSACPLAKSGKSAEQLEVEFYQWLYNLKQKPISLGITALETYTSVKAFVYSSLYAPAGWSNVSKVLDAAYKQDVSLLTELIGAQPKSAADSAGDVTDAIKCSDKTARTSTFKAWLPKVRKIQDASKAIGDGLVQQQAVCAQWKMPAVEIYQGDFKVKTKNPILFANNEFDPVTPLVGAKNMSSGFARSALLVNKNGYGVSSKH